MTQKLTAQSHLPYPIELFMPKKWALLFVVFGLCMSFPLTVDYLDDKSVSLKWYFFATLDAACLLFSIFLGFSKSPALTITLDGINYFTVFKRNFRAKILWSNTIGIFTMNGFHPPYGATYYYISYPQKQGKSYRTILFKMLYKGKLLNQNEIFNLLEQSFNGKKYVKFQPSKVSHHRTNKLMHIATAMFLLIIVTTIALNLING